MSSQARHQPAHSRVRVQRRHPGLPGGGGYRVHVRRRRAADREPRRRRRYRLHPQEPVFGGGVPGRAQRRASATAGALRQLFRHQRRRRDGVPDDSDAGTTGRPGPDRRAERAPGQYRRYGQNTASGAVAGIPGLTLPAGLTRSGLPVGIELDGPMGSDRVLLGIGMALQRSTFRPLRAPKAQPALA